MTVMVPAQFFSFRDFKAVLPFADLSTYWPGLLVLDLIILLSYCMNAHLECIILVCDESGLYCFVIS